MKRQNLRLVFIIILRDGRTPWYYFLKSGNISRRKSRRSQWGVHPGKGRVLNPKRKSRLFPNRLHCTPETEHSNIGGINYSALRARTSQRDDLTTEAEREKSGLGEKIH